MRLIKIDPASQAPIEQQRPASARPFSARIQPDIVQAALVRRAAGRGFVHPYGSPAADALDALAMPGADVPESLERGTIRHVITTPAPVHWVDWSKQFDVTNPPPQPLKLIPANPRRRGLIFQNSNADETLLVGEEMFVSFGLTQAIAGSPSGFRVGLSPPVQVGLEDSNLQYFPIVMEDAIISTDDIYLSWSTGAPPIGITAYEAIDAVGF